MSNLTKEQLLELKSYWAARKNELLRNWDFYYGEPQKKYLQKFSGETEAEFQSRIDNATIENHCAKTCDVLVGYLYGKNGGKGRITVRAVDKNGEIIEPLQRVLHDNVWKFNTIESLRIDIALMASVCGNAVVHKEFVDSRTMTPFALTASSADKKKYGTVRYDLFDTVTTKVLPKVQNGEVYARMLGGVIRHYSRDNFSGSSYLDRLLNKRYQVEDVFEYFTDETISRSIYTDESEFEANVQTQPNPYKDINMLFTNFRNYGDPMYLEGASDLAQMIQLQTMLNEILNDDKATVAYHSFPLLIIAGGGKLPQNFIRKVNSALEVPEGADVKYLTWENVLEASDNLKESIRLNMTVASSVSQISRGNASQIGQVRSGAGLKTLFQSDLNAIGLKIPQFENAEIHLAETTLKIFAKETGLELPEGWRVTAEFNQDLLGLDDLLIKAQTDQMETSSGVASLREKIKERNPDLVSEAEVDEIIATVIAERKKLAMATKPPTPGIKPAESTAQKSNQQK